MAESIIPRFLETGSVYLLFANLFLGMIFMVVLHCLFIAVRGREIMYFFLSFFFIGALINAVGNLYIHFFITTVEPYIGSWIMLTMFILFVDSYLSLPESRERRMAKRVLLWMSAIFLSLSVLHNILHGIENNWMIVLMDIFSALIILLLLLFLVVHTLKRTKRAGALLVFEIIIVLGAISAMGIFKTGMEERGLLPLPLLQGNFLFLIGMTVNGLLFTYLLHQELTGLKVQRALAESRSRELKEMDSLRNEFFMNVSHELRTPLTVIGGIVKQLKEGRWGDSISANRGQLRVIERNNSRMLKQVNNLLELSRIEEHRRKKLSYETINLKKALPQLAGEFQSLAEQRGITLLVEVSEKILLRADDRLFKRALINIISNALKFTEPGGTVTVGAEYRGTGKDALVRVFVADTGIGIPKEEQDLIFKRFHQVRHSGEFSFHGSGIGLSLVQEVLYQHGGRVFCESSPGKGSSFILDFPRFPIPVKDRDGAREDSKKDRKETQGEYHEECGEITEDAGFLSWYKAELEEYTEKAIAPGEAMDGSGIDGITNNGGDNRMPVLLVEDSRDLADYLRTELSPFFNLTVAGNGREALRTLENVKALKKKLPHCIISDIMMPEMDGHELFEELAKREDTKEIPFLFLTARDSEEEKIDSLEKGAVDYIEKPFSTEMLITKVKNLLKRKQDYQNKIQKNVKESLLRHIEDFRFDDSTGPDKPVQEDIFEKVIGEANLTAREGEIALLLRRGLSDKEIADELGIAVKTVGNYNGSIFRKIGVSGRLELVALGRE